MKRPAFQFYPADWRKDAALQSCSMSAQGLWVNLMCIAHECEPYGYLVVNGKPMTEPQIARLVGLGPKECARSIAELDAAGVASRREDGAIFSRRMVRDEDIRERRAEGGKAGSEHGIKGAEHGIKGGRPSNGRGVIKPPFEPPIEPPPSSSSSSSASAVPLSSSAVGDIVGPAPLRAAPPSAPAAFDGTNSEAMNGKAIAPIAANFTLPDTWGLDAEALGFKPGEVLREGEKFRQYWTAGKGAGTRRSAKGWRQTWSNWLEKAAKDAR